MRKFVIYVEIPKNEVVRYLDLPLYNFFQGVNDSHSKIPNSQEFQDSKVQKIPEFHEFQIFQNSKVFRISIFSRIQEYSRVAQDGTSTKKVMWNSKFDSQL